MGRITERFSNAEPVAIVSAKLTELRFLALIPQLPEPEVCKSLQEKKEWKTH